MLPRCQKETYQLSAIILLKLLILKINFNEKDLIFLFSELDWVIINFTLYILKRNFVSLNFKQTELKGKAYNRLIFNL